MKGVCGEGALGQAPVEQRRARLLRSPGGEEGGRIGVLAVEVGARPRSSALHGDRRTRWREMRSRGAAALKLETAVCEHAQGQDPTGTVTPLLVTGHRVVFGDALAVGREDAALERA